MKNSHWKEWFVFTKKERTGIIVLIVLILTATCLPWFYTAHFTIPDKNLTKRLYEELIQAHTVADSSSTTPDDERSLPHYELPAEKKPPVLFEFDPNTLSADGWRKLGIRERAVQIILKYLSRGGKFRQPADLKKIYGLREEETIRLIPFVRIRMQEATHVKHRENFPTYKKREPSVIDINTADTSAFIALPGIGSKLARRIITFREKLGGFYSVEQVKETYGLADSTFQKIRGLLQVNAGGVQRININTAVFEELNKHPYIDRNLANAIVKYREQHGNFNSIEDLQKIVLVTGAIFQKISPYLAVE